MNQIKIKLVYLTLALFASPVCIAETHFIRVSGSAEVSVVPDLAHFTFAINERGEKLVEVKARVDKKTGSVVALTEQLGINKRDVTASRLSIRPQYNYQSRAFLGYQVTRDVKVTLRDLDHYSALVNGAIKAGITNVNNVSLDTSDKDALELKALAAASEKARLKANQLARSSGLKLDQVLNIEESGAGAPEPRYMFKTSATTAERGGAFEPGEITVRSSLTISYAIATDQSDPPSN